jgi:uncharacterized protein
MKNFKEKYGPWAVITGATDGIGLSMAKIIAAQGINLVLISRRIQILDKLAHELSAINNIKTLTIALDVSSIGATQFIIDKIQQLDIGLFIAAAGFGSAGEFLALDLSNEINMIEVNCKAVVEQSHYFANLMMKNKKGGIILFSSIVAFQGTPLSTTYGATKAFMQSFAEGLTMN